MIDTRSINPVQRKTVHYLNNAEFKAALDAYGKACEEAGEDLRVPEYIGQCIVNIANGLARRPNFAGYSWREEMVGDAIEKCLIGIRKFDVNRGTSALGYFSQICWYEFLGRIALEKKQNKIKREIVRYAGVDTFALQGHDETGEFTLNLQEFLASVGDDPPPPPKKQVAVKPSPLEGFME